MREHLLVWWLLFRCKVRGTHAPLPIVDRGSMYVRCASCRLRTRGIDLSCSAVQP
jgi:hypothetical protein